MQVGDNLYLIADSDATSPSMNCLTNLNDRRQNLRSVRKSAPPNKRGAPGLANFNDICIFIGGGHDADDRDMSSVDMYTIEFDDWSSAPELNQARSGLSICAQGDKLYAMFGYLYSQDTNVNMIETLDARKWIDGVQVEWTVLHLASGEISPRGDVLVVPIGPNELAILGGDCDDMMLSDATILNTETNTAETVVQKGQDFIFSSLCQQSYMTGSS